MLRSHRNDVVYIYNIYQLTTNLTIPCVTFVQNRGEKATQIRGASLFSESTHPGDVNYEPKDKLQIALHEWQAVSSWSQDVLGLSEQSICSFYTETQPEAISVQSVVSHDKDVELKVVTYHLICKQESPLLPTKPGSFKSWC